MNIKKITAALITAAMALSMTACAENGEPSTTTPSNSGGDIFDNNETSVSEPSKEVTMWDVIPEIPVTDASAFEYKYDSELGGMVITNYLRESPKVRIPDTIEGEPVVGLNLSNCEKELTEIVMPDTVKEFDFSSATKHAITFINIPKSVTEIGYGAFSDCTSLTSITIPDSVTEIGEYAFAGCSLTSVTIPDSVTEIGEYAFSVCRSLTSVTIPDSVTSIIGDGAFWACTSLTSATYKGKTYSYNNIDELYDAINYGDDMVQVIDGVLTDCSEKATEVVIPDSVTKIGAYAFQDCTSLTSVTIPDSVTLIGESAFDGCTSLTSITIPDSVTKIGSWAFWDCTSLTSITIPDSVTLIGESAFSGCTSLTSITIPDSVTKIGEFAFDGCTSLTSVNYKGKTYSYDNINDLYAAINGN